MPRLRGKMKQCEIIKVRDVPAVVLALTGVSVTPATAYRWVSVGRRNYAGGTSKLRTTRRAGHPYTCKIWIEDFLREL